MQPKHNLFFFLVHFLFPIQVTSVAFINDGACKASGHLDGGREMLMLQSRPDLHGSICNFFTEKIPQLVAFPQSAPTDPPKAPALYSAHFK